MFSVFQWINKYITHEVSCNLCTIHLLDTHSLHIGRYGYIIDLCGKRFKKKIQSTNVIDPNDLFKSKKKTYSFVFIVCMH